ncbi:MAG: aldo/keto reductase [Clostridiales bacterium]
MLYRDLGKSGIKASVIAYGSWAIGGWMWGGTDEKQAIESIHAAIDSGINFIDTAPIYGFGASEKIIGKALKKNRSKIVIASKCGMVWDSEKGDYFFSSDIDSIKSTNGELKIHKYLGKNSIRKEVEESLKRLDTDYIDLYQTHWQENTTPIEETMETLLKLKEEGKIRAIGVCNASIDQLKKYSSIGQLDSDQEKYSLIDRKLENTNLKHVVENNMGFLAYSPLANGLLTGRVTPDREFPESDLRHSNPRFTVENRINILEKLKKLDSLKEKYNATYTQLILAWTFSQKGSSHVLAGARTIEQSLDNAKAGDINLSKDDLKLFNKFKK